MELMSIIPVLGRRREETSKFQVSLGYIACSRLAWVHGETPCLNKQGEELEEEERKEMKRRRKPQTKTRQKEEEEETSPKQNEAKGSNNLQEVQGRTQETDRIKTRKYCFNVQFFGLTNNIKWQKEFKEIRSK